VIRGRTLPISVAPMMDVTDQHTRWLYRQISRRVLLYTEMVTTHALEHGDAARLLAFDPVEHPVALQVGGDDPARLARAARMGEDAGYDEININIGCPSPRVQRGNFGACLMQTPQVVAEGVAAMRAAVAVPVTVKCRIGVDDLDAYEDLLRFADAVAAAGADRLTVHARKAWLQGLSPKENRTVPPLRPEVVHRLKRERPALPIEINGGIRDLDTAEAHLSHVDAVMIGRGVWHDPWLLADVDRRFFGQDGSPDREAVAESLIPYVERMEAAGHNPQHVLRHAVPLFAGVPGARRWKQALARAHRGGADAVREGLAALRAVRARQARWEADRALRPTA
jgi:tRNA-dihydrouridine synthase A